METTFCIVASKTEAPRQLSPHDACFRSKLRINVPDASVAIGSSCAPIPGSGVSTAVVASSVSFIIAPRPSRSSVQDADPGFYQGI